MSTSKVACLVAVALIASPNALWGQGLRNRAPLPKRAQLEQRLHERLAVVVQRELKLSDEQMQRLSQVNQSYETKRLELVRRERQTRIGLRQELMASATANEEKVLQLLQESARIQRERLDLVEAEQGDLAKFLTPSQRARYLGLQEQMRRRIEEFRDRPPFVRGDGPAAGGRADRVPLGRRRPPPVP